MYEAETEDQIPRCAPKPSTSAVNEAIVRPSVPEVSIVFTQPQSTSQSDSTPSSTTASYAAWKKQCLPQEISKNDFPGMASRSNVYPMRSAAAAVLPVKAIGTQLSPNPPGDIKNWSISVQAQPNMESPMAQSIPTVMVAVPRSEMDYNSNQQNKYMDHTGHVPAHSMDTNTLTICAETQTEFLEPLESFEINFNHLATKKDVAQMKAVLVSMQTEQRRLIEIVQQLLIAQARKQDEFPCHTLKDFPTQCNAQTSMGPLPQKRPHNRYDSIEEEDSAEEGDSYSYPKKTNIPTESPSKSQTFQSFAFRAAFFKRAEFAFDLPKPATEQSMVMNELALKYIPNEKLSDLLGDMHVSPLSLQEQEDQKGYETPPLKNIENYNKDPVELSTASYKYLKKYRLLPEENNNLSPPANDRKINSPNQQENMLDLETIRRQPKFM